MGLQSSVYPLASFSTPSAISADTDILPSDISVTKENLEGTAGLYRVWFTLNTTADADFNFIIRRTNPNDTITTTRSQKVNSDNEFILKSGGYYRFDIDVILGDEINFHSSVGIDSVSELRVHQIQIGA